MESRPAFLHPPRNNEPKASWESESQHRKGNLSPGTRTRLGENHGIEVQAKEREETSTSRESASHMKTLKHSALATAAVPATEPLPTSTAASKIPTMHSATTKQVSAGIASATATIKMAATKKTAPGVEVLSLSSQSGPSGPKPRSPNASHEKKLQPSAKTFSKNMQKTASASHIMGSVDSPQKIIYKTASASQISSSDSPKSLNRTSLSHIPRATSSPKLKPPHPASLKVDKTERNRRVMGKEGLLATSPKEKMIDTLVESKLKLGTKAAMGELEIKSGNDRKEMLGDKREFTVMNSKGCKEISSPPYQATNPSVEKLKEPEDKSDAYVRAQESHTRESQRGEKKGREEAECEDRRKTGGRKREAEIKNDNMATVMNEKNKISTSKSLKDAVTMTVEGFPVIETKDAALQADLQPVYVDVEVQADVEVCSRSTDTSPVHDSQPQNLNPEIDLNPKVGIHNELNLESNSDSDWLSSVASPDPKPTGAKPRFLGPPPYKSPNSQKPLQHVCQIEIELCSQSPQPLGSVPPQVSKFDASSQVFPGVAEKTSEDFLKLLNSGRTAGVEGKTEESGPPQEIVWDEQGMTWEVYGASLDLESLGFAIQNHLQCKIREHERRIGSLRRSICLSEQSPGMGRTGKKKRNVFRSLFAGSRCCSKPRPKEEAEK